MEPLLEISDLHTQIRRRRDVVRAVDGVSLSVAPGRTLGIVGESGCGKTMTALSIMRLLPAGGHISSGAIHFAGRDLAALNARQMAALRADRIGMVFQDPLSALNPTMTIGAQIAETVRLHRDITRQDARDRAAEVLDLVGIPGARSRLGDYPHQLSGGMRQRVVIGMALACEPDLLIADEPTTALDVTTQREILGLFQDLRSRFGMAMILVTHDLGVIAGLADEVSVMYAGKIVESASAAELFRRPRHRYTEALLAAIPESSRREGPLRNIPGLPPSLIHPPDGCRFAPRCAHAQEDCRAAEPPLLEHSDGHHFACIHPAAPTAATRTRTDDAPAEVARERPEIIRTEHLVKDYTGGRLLHGRRRISAVADISLSIGRGETFGLVGESGCGKSTLGRLLVALEKPTTGSVRIGGQDLLGLPARTRKRARRGLQLVFQDASAALDPRMRAGSILLEPLRIQGIGDRHSQRELIRTLLDDVGLPRRAVERYPHEFSGGQRQRLALARALALEPEVVIADEPVSALDVSVQAQILNLMGELQHRRDLTYVLISHDLAVVRYLADRIGVMYLGKLVELGDRDAVYENSLHPYTRGLIESAPVPDPAIERAADTAAVTGELPSAANPPSGCRFRTRCPLAQDLCARIEPPLRKSPDRRHWAACHFPLGPLATLDQTGGHS